MKTLSIILILSSGLISCNSRTKTNENDRSNVLFEENIENKAVGDSIFKINGFLFEGPKNMKFEFVRKGEIPKLKTNGDTLYSDNEIVLLGDIEEVKSPGVFKKFKFKSQFQDFKTAKIFKGRLAKPDFSTDPDARHFITRIKNGCKDMGVNFAGHYTIIEWGCGAVCQEIALVDRIDGNIIYSQIPFDTIDGHCGLDYKIDSRMLIVNTEAFSENWEYESGYKRDYWRKPAVYEIKNGKLTQIE